MPLTDFQRASLREHLHATSQLVDSDTGEVFEPGGGASFTVVACSEQTALFASGGGGTPNDGSIGQDTGGFAVHNLMRFPLTDIEAITKAWLEIVITNNNNCLGNAEGVNAFWHVYRMLRTDINYTQATHSVYKTGSNWGTAGGIGAADRTAEGRVGIGPFTGAAAITLMNGATIDRRVFDVTEMVRAAIAAAQANIDFSSSASATSGQNAFATASRTHGTAALQPKLIWVA